MAERLRRGNSGDDRCQADVCQSRQFAVCREREAHSDGDQLYSHCFHFTSFCEGSPPKQKIPEHLERKEHKSIADLREDISGGIQLPSVDVKNPHANFSDLENSVPPGESNEDLLDQAWDDHTGESWDAKKVKEARQLEMEYDDKMHVFEKVPIAQCWERTGKAPLKARWVDIDKGTRYRSRLVAKQFKGSDSEEWFAATPPIEALRALISHTMSGPKKETLMVCDVSRAFLRGAV